MPSSSTLPVKPARVRSIWANCLAVGLLVACSVFPLTSAEAIGGGMDGGGGGQGFVCRNRDGAVRSAQLLDLVEAENFFMLKIQNFPTQNYRQIAKHYVEIADAGMTLVYPTSDFTIAGHPRDLELSPMLFTAPKHRIFKLQALIDEIDREKMLSPGNVVIAPLGDSHPRILPAGQGCHLEQIAIYTDDTEKLHVPADIWVKLSETHKAAFLFHEALYRVMRNFGETNSDHARRIVGYLFSGMKFTDVVSGVPAKYLTCWTNENDPTFQFVVYLDKDNFPRVNFLVYAGQVVMSKVEGSFNIFPFAKFGVNLNGWRTLDGLSFSTKNPLLDLPDFEITNRDGDRSFIDASPRAGGPSPKQVLCNERFSEVTKIPLGEGIIAVGQALPSAEDFRR